MELGRQAQRNLDPMTLLKRRRISFNQLFKILNFDLGLGQNLLSVHRGQISGRQWFERLSRDELLDRVFWRDWVVDGDVETLGGGEVQAEAFLLEEEVACERQLPQGFSQAEVDDVLVQVQIAKLKGGMLLEHQHVVLKSLLRALSQLSR